MTFRSALLVLCLSCLSTAFGQVVYVSYTSDSTIEQFTTGGADLGTFADVFSTGGMIQDPTGLIFDSSGTMYVANTVGGGGDYIETLSSTGTPLASFGATYLTGPEGMAFDSIGNLYVANSGSNTVAKFDSSGKFVTSFAGPDLTGPVGIAVNSGTSTVYVTNSNNKDGSTIEEFSLSGTYLGSFGLGHLGGPTGLALDGSGNVWVANSNNGHLIEFSSDGSSILANFDTHLGSIGGLTFYNGDLYVTSVTHDLTGVFSTSGTELTTLSNTELGNPSFAAISAIPEPAAVAAIMGAVALGFGWRRRRANSGDRDLAAKRRR